MSRSGSLTNYTLIGKNKKAERKIDTSRITEIKKSLIFILKEDKEYWDNLGEPQVGIEKNILLSKICQKEPSTCKEIFDYLLEELEVEQKVIPIYRDNLTRFIYFNLIGNRND